MNFLPSCDLPLYSQVMSEDETIDASAELSRLLMSSYEYQQGQQTSVQEYSSLLNTTPSGRNAVDIDVMQKCYQQGQQMSDQGYSSSLETYSVDIDVMKKWLSNSSTSTGTANAKENYLPLSLPSVSTGAMSKHTPSTRARDEPSISPNNSHTLSARARDKIRSNKKFQRFLEQSSSFKKKSGPQPQPPPKKQNDDNDPTIASSKLWNDGQQQQQENVYQAKTPSKSSKGSGSGRRQPLQDITQTVLDQECRRRQQQDDISQTPELDRAIAASKFCTPDGSRLRQQEDTSQSEIDRVIAASKFYTGADSHYSQTNRDLRMQNPKRKNLGGGDTNYSRADLEYGANCDGIPNSIQAAPVASIKPKGCLRQRSYGSSSDTSSVFAKDVFGEISNVTMDSKLQSACKQKQGVAMDYILQSARKPKQEAAVLQSVCGHVFEDLDDYPTDEDTSHYSDPPIDHYNMSSPEIQPQQLKSNGRSSRKNRVSFIDDDSHSSDPSIVMYQSSPDSQPLERQYCKKAQQVCASGAEEESQYSDPPIEFYPSSPDSSQSSEPRVNVLKNRLHSQPKARSGSDKKPRDSHPSSDKFMFSPEKQPLKRRSHLGDYTLQPNRSISPRVDSFPKDALETGHLGKPSLNEEFCLNTGGAGLETHLALPVTPSPPRLTRSVQVKPAILPTEAMVDARLTPRSQSMPPRVVCDMQASPAVSCLTIPYMRSTPQSSGSKAMKKPRFQPHSQKLVNQHRDRPPLSKPVDQLESKHANHQSCMSIPGRHRFPPKAQPQVQKKMKDLIEQRAARLDNSVVSPRSDEALSPVQRNALTPSNPARREGETPLYIEYVQASALTCASPMNESFGTGISYLTAVSFLADNSKASVPDLPKKALWVDTVPKKQKEQYYTDPVKPREVLSCTNSCLPSISGKESVSRRGIARLNCFAKPSHYSTLATVDSEKQRLFTTPRTVTPTSQRTPSVEDYAQFHISRERLDI